MQFSLLETVVYHRWLWAELAETGSFDKWGAEFWEQTKINPKDVYIRCFPCEYASDSCERCPVELDRCASDSSPYEKWLRANSTEKRKYWAAQIRDAELKPEFKELLGE